MANVEGNVCWTQEEWQKLADIVEPMRLNDISSPLTQLVRKALEQFPEDRRRDIKTTLQVTPLVEELQQRYDKYRFMQNQIQSLQSRLEHKNIDDELKTQVLENCSPEELLNYITPDVTLSHMSLSDLLSYVGRRVAEALTSRQVYHVENMTQPVKIQEETFVRKGFKKVYVAGPLPAQFHQLSKLVGPICDLRLITELNDIQPGGDLYIAWIKFINHAKSEKMKSVAKKGTYHQVPGAGIENLASVIQNLVITSVG